jgi:two-component system, NarL family, sensor kinase
MHTPSPWLFQQAIIIAAVLLGIVIIFFFISLIRQQRRNINLYRAKVKAEITTLENERKRIAKDLHDDVGPLLSSVRFRVDAIDDDPENSRALIEKSTSQIDDIIKRMREIAAGLLPNTLIRSGLQKAVEEFVDKVNHENVLKISFNMQCGAELTEEQQLNIYRIVQEITHNTMKHAGANQLRIELMQQKQRLWLTAKDDGIGFDMQQKTSSGGGLGLLSLSSRAEVLGAKLSCHTGRGNGTSYIFDIPLRTS